MFDELKANEYRTPEQVPRLWLDKVFFKTRLSAYFTLLGIVTDYRPKVLKGEYDDDTWAFSSLDLLHRLEGCEAKFHIKGFDILRNHPGPGVFVANHMSTLDPLILPGLINPLKPCTFVAKESLVKGWLWGPIMRSRNPILVTRTDPRKDLERVLSEGVAHLSQGRSVIIFPQGTRKDEFLREDFSSLGVKLASKAGVPVFPVALKADYWGNSRILRGFGPIRRNRVVHFEFGSPIPVTGRGKAEHEAVLDFIEERLASWAHE